MDSAPAQLAAPASLPGSLARLPPQFWHRAGVRAGLAFGTLAGKPIEAAGQRMDPTMSALIRFVRKLPQGGAAGGGGLHGLLAFRKQYEAAPGLTGLHPDPLVPPQPVPGLPGAREYTPARPPRPPARPSSELAGAHEHTPTVPRATMLFFHGGGFIIGSPATHDALCRRLARRADVRVISAAYPLAPEHPFPAAHDAAGAAWDWVRANRPGPYILAGDSAGANLAAGLGLGGGQGEPAALMALLYPVTDMLHQDGLYPSIELFREGYLLTAAGLEECARLLLPTGGDRADPRLSPLRADLSHAAPSLVMTAGFDPLRDQGRAWVTALQASGRPAWLLEEEGLVHGFADFAGVVPAARRAVDRLAAAVAARLDEGAARA